MPIHKILSEGELLRFIVRCVGFAPTTGTCQIYPLRCIFVMLTCITLFHSRTANPSTQNLLVWTAKGHERIGGHMALHDPLQLLWPIRTFYRWPSLLYPSYYNPPGKCGASSLTPGARVETGSHFGFGVILADIESSRLIPRVGKTNCTESSPARASAGTTTQFLKLENPTSAIDRWVPRLVFSESLPLVLES